MKTIVLVTGGFDPIHSGHIAYFKAAKKLGDILVVGINSDNWLAKKKGRAFMPFTERISVIENLKMVDHCLVFDDSDGSAINAIKNVRMLFPEDLIIFANGGDRTRDNIPEMDFLDEKLEFVFAVGGEDKKNSSSWILDEWKAPKTVRPWGWYRVLYEQPGTKVKELIVEPGQSLSMQKHSLRSERWHVVSGSAVVKSTTERGYQLPSLTISTHASFNLEIDQWHQLTNPFEEPCKIIEIQYGIECAEEDIKRLT